MEKYPGPADADTVENEMVQIISNSAHRVPVPVGLLAGCLAFSAYDRLPFWIVATWLALAFGIIALRYFTFKRLPKLRHLSAHQRLNWVVALNLAAGLTYSLVCLAFPYMTATERAFATVVVTTMATCATITTPSKIVGALMYIVPIMGGMSLTWATLDHAEDQTLLGRWLPLLIFLYALINVNLAKEMNRSIVESWRIRLRERDLNQKLQHALADAESASNAKTRFLAAASHDLRQPLHTISTVGSALSLRPLDNRTKEIVQFLNTVIASFTSQMDGLLDISKLDAGVIEIHKKSLDLSAMVRQHAAEISDQVKAKGLHLNLLCEEGCRVDSDEFLILRVLRNLTHNAIKFTERGVIAIELRHVGDAVELVVRDTGCGISVDQQEKVFQEFYQVSNPERDRSQGLGLGLSIVQRLVHLLDIKMEMKSSPKNGTQFTLALPRGRNAPSPVEAAQPLPPPKNIKVLVVDDEVDVRSGLRILLEELDCQFLEASGTHEAKALVEAIKPDLLLADFRLRGQDDGLKAINAVRARWPDVHAVLVSGDTAPNRLQEAQQAGVNLIHKPLELNMLKALLSKAVLGQTKAADALS